MSQDKSKEVKMTPGPWSRDKYGHIVDHEGNDVLFRSVSILGSGAAERMAMAEANTDLAAAAPELLEALKKAIETTYSDTLHAEWSALVAKALGQSGGTK